MKTFGPVLILGALLLPFFLINDSSEPASISTIEFDTPILNETPEKIARQMIPVPVVQEEINMQPEFLKQPTLTPLPLDLDEEPEPEPYRRQAINTDGWTGALVCVSDPEKAIRGEPTSCVPCNTVTNRLNAYAAKTQWTVGLTPECHFRYVFMPDIDTPTTIYYLSGKEVSRIVGIATTRKLIESHPSYRGRKDQTVQAQTVVSAPQAVGCFGVSQAQPMGCFGSQSQAVGCFGFSQTQSYGMLPQVQRPRSTYLTETQQHLIQDHGFGFSYVASLSPAQAESIHAQVHSRSYAMPVMRSRVYSQPTYCGPNGCYGTQAGLFGGTSQNSYSLIGLNFGVGF